MPLRTKNASRFLLQVVPVPTLPAPGPRTRRERSRRRSSSTEPARVAALPIGFLGHRLDQAPTTLTTNGDPTPQRDPPIAAPILVVRGEMPGESYLSPRSRSWRSCSSSRFRAARSPSSFRSRSWRSCSSLRSRSWRSALSRSVSTSSSSDRLPTSHYNHKARTRCTSQLQATAQIRGYVS